MKHLHLHFWCVATFLSLSWAQEIRYAAELNHVAVGVRTVGMGNAAVSLPQNGVSAYWNPALLGLCETYEVWLEGARMYGGLGNLGVLSLAGPVPRGPTLGVSYTGYFSGDIVQQDSLPGSPHDRLFTPELRPNENTSAGIFHNNHHIVMASAARAFRVPLPRPAGFAVPLPIDISGGLNFKCYWQTMSPGDEMRVSMNVNVDAGLVVRVGVDYDLAEQRISREVILGVSAKDVFPTKVMWLHSYTSYEEPVDRSLYYGISYADRTGLLRAAWTISLALKKSYRTSAHAGIEAVFLDRVAFRAGVSDRIPTIGAGINVGLLTIDYACSFDELAFTPIRLALGVSF